MVLAQQLWAVHRYHQHPIVRLRVQSESRLQENMKQPTMKLNK
jgi:hypothetical protein